MNRRLFLMGMTAVPATLAGARSAELPGALVHKDPSCGCCAAWAEHLRRAGFPVEVVDTSSLNRVKTRLGVPDDLASCHTAEIGGYIVEGHVPAEAIKRLLAAAPQARGLAVPGMPIGSPGMEVPGATPDTFEVVLFGPAGRSTFARYHGERRLSS